jgi:hypothetical protein
MPRIGVGANLHVDFGSPSVKNGGELATRRLAESRS